MLLKTSQFFLANVKNFKFIKPAENTKLYQRVFTKIASLQSTNPSQSRVTVPFNRNLYGSQTISPSTCMHRDYVYHVCLFDSINSLVKYMYVYINKFILTLTAYVQYRYTMAATVLKLWGHKLNHFFSFSTLYRETFWNEYEFLCQNLTLE